MARRMKTAEAEGAHRERIAVGQRVTRPPQEVWVCCYRRTGDGNRRLIALGVVGMAVGIDHVGHGQPLIRGALTDDIGGVGRVDDNTVAPVFVE